MRKSDGSVTLSAQEFDDRWVEYFASIYNADTVSRLSVINFLPPSHRSVAGVPPTPLPSKERVGQALRALPNGKAVGPDKISCEVMKLCPGPFENFLFEICCEAFRSRYAPLMWRGGRIQSLFKKGTL